jgi:hypothetical protein
MITKLRVNLSANFSSSHPAPSIGASIIPSEGCGPAMSCLPCDR